MICVKIPRELSQKLVIATGRLRVNRDRGIWGDGKAALSQKNDGSIIGSVTVQSARKGMEDGACAL